MCILTYVLTVCSGLQPEIISHWVRFTKLISEDNLHMSFKTLIFFVGVG